MPEQEEVLSLAEASRMLKISIVTARRWCKEGKLPAVKIGNHFRIRKSDIMKIFDEKIRTLNKDKYEKFNSTIS